MPARHKSQKALIPLWAALFLWGMHGPMGRYLALRNVPILAVMSLRLWIGSIVFWTVLLVAKKFKPVPLTFLPKLLFLSVVGVYLNSVPFHYGMNYIPATLVMLFENLSPFFVIFLIWMIESKRPSKTETFCQIIAFSGVLLIMLGKGGLRESGEHFYLGVALEVLAGITWAIYGYFSAKWVQEIGARETHEKFFPSLNMVCQLFTVAAVISSPHLLSLKGAVISQFDWTLIIILGLFQTGITFMLWNYALTILPVTMVSTSFYMTIVFTCINDVLFLGLKLNWILVVGALLILGSALKLTRAAT